jgi:alkylation response protein AidB-like acyl-CoA dehydrogenase
MITPWWDELHWTMWRMTDRSALLPVVESARRVAREVVVPLLASGERNSCEWTTGKSRLIDALDASGLNSILSTTGHGIATPLALAAWELAWVDGGAAANILSGSMAQMPILDFGTSLQREIYLGNAAPRHGALCLTEPVPGAGSDALFLTGSFEIAKEPIDGEPTLHIEKRGRFISHMDFADFVVAAVQAQGNHAKGSCLVILEPEDAGEFDRGTRLHKVGHQLSSTTNPSFNMHIPASRIIGGYTIDDGVLIPNIDHRHALGPAFRRTRAVLSLMTAAKLLSTVESFVHSSSLLSEKSPLWQRMVELWAVGEAAASLGFSAARISDDLDRAGAPSPALVSRCAVLSPAAKLFSTNRVTTALQSVAVVCERWTMRNAFNLQDKIADTQIEAVQMGPEAIQRRQLSAAMIDGHFLREFCLWTEEMERIAHKRKLPMLRCLTEGMQLWQWTLNQLQQQTDSRGRRLYSDARQSVTFAMADALSGLLAARSFILDLLESGKCTLEGSETPSIMSDLATIASLRAAGSVGQTSAELLLGYGCQFSSATRNELNNLSRKLDVSLCGTLTARARAERFLSELRQKHGKEAKFKA